MSIIPAARQHGPGDARQLIGDRYDHLVARCTLGQSVHPLPESSRLVLNPKQA